MPAVDDKSRNASENRYTLLNLFALNCNLLEKGWPDRSEGDY